MEGVAKSHFLLNTVVFRSGEPYQIGSKKILKPETLEPKPDHLRFMICPDETAPYVDPLYQVGVGLWVGGLLPNEKGTQQNMNIHRPYGRQYRRDIRGFLRIR